MEFFPPLEGSSKLKYRGWALGDGNVTTTSFQRWLTCLQHTILLPCKTFCFILFSIILAIVSIRVEHVLMLLACVFWRSGCFSLLLKVVEQLFPMSRGGGSHALTCTSSRSGFVTKEQKELDVNRHRRCARRRFIPERNSTTSPRQFVLLPYIWKEKWLLLTFLTPRTEQGDLKK